MVSEVVLIVTFQTAAIAHALRAGTPLSTQGSFIQKDWAGAYGWMRQQMIRRVGTPTVEDGLLMWGWPLGSAPSDADTGASETHPLHRITLTLALEDVLRSDFHAWHVVLADHYLSSDEADGDRYDGQLRQGEVSSEQEKQASWERVFHPERLCDAYWGPRAKRIYQLCFWQPRPSAIASVRQIPS